MLHTPLCDRFLYNPVELFETIKVNRHLDKKKFWLNFLLIFVSDENISHDEHAH